jgi:hypothetical protein
MESADFLYSKLFCQYRISLGHLKNNFKHPNQVFYNFFPLVHLEVETLFFRSGCFLLHRTLQTSFYKTSLVLQLLERICTVLLLKLPGAFILYKTRERIHRDMLIRDYYLFQLHGGEFQPPI